MMTTTTTMMKKMIIYRTMVMVAVVEVKTTTKMMTSIKINAVFFLRLTSYRIRSCYMSSGNSFLRNSQSMTNSMHGKTWV